MERPWMKFSTRDWLDNKELRRCSPLARAILIDLMALAHEGTPYGHLADKLGPLSTVYLAQRCMVNHIKFRKATEELVKAERLHLTEGQVFFYIKRMVEDEALRLSRASGGSFGGNPSLKPKVNPKVNLHVNLEVNMDSRERARRASDSGSVSGSSEVKTTTTNKTPTRARGLADEEFQNFMGGFISLGVAVSETDLRKCAGMWASMAFSERVAAFQHARGMCLGDWASCASRYVPRPWNYLGDRQWERLAIVEGRLKSATRQELSHAMAAKRFMEGD